MISAPASSTKSSSLGSESVLKEGGCRGGGGKAAAATCPGGTWAAAGVRLQVGDDSGWAAGPRGWASAQSALGVFFK